jgi:hypothetical protein
MLQIGINENFVEMSVMGMLQIGIKAHLSIMILHGPFSRALK